MMDLAMNLRAFISQRLVKTVDGKRAAAVEILLGTSTIQEKILKDELHEIKEIMSKSEGIGMQTFDSALFQLYKAGKIDLDEAIRNADSANNLRLRIKLAEGDGSLGDDEEASNILSLELTQSEIEEMQKQEEEERKKEASASNGKASFSLDLPE